MNYQNVMKKFRIGDYTILESELFGSSRIESNSRKYLETSDT